MKMYKHIILGLFILFFAFACNKGIDDITPVAPGADLQAPAIDITYPNGNVVISYLDTSTTVNFKFKVTDDIELKTYSVSLDGTVAKTFNSFKDYRISIESYLSGILQLGDHSIKIDATDLAGKTTTKTYTFTITNVYTAKYAGEVFFMPFEAQMYTELITKTNATVVGTPGFDTGKAGQAYAGATDSYLTFPTDGITGASYSAAFWYKVNSSPDRSGILNASITGEDRTKGFRIFREGSASLQRIKLNIGTGTEETWNNGQEITATAPGWVHIAFTVSPTHCIIYIDGVVAADVANTAGIDWTGCNAISIGSGQPNFAYWGHGADLSLYDELRLFNKELSQTEIQAIIADENL